ncbi:hypothetical protein XA68_15545 [Ophiocordyceps unilateralis]|uniref:ER membrane protein complex subunit 7 beta-sandwich domain-containing protein n=1 Tax=Ophiocordyceps unilateralis TaxID=268505 RepID=A0A2A9PM89_OPHUN|nr:hypothetical protein XA68_15545 [Ophiocordyceps unilateralis]
MPPSIQATMPPSIQHVLHLLLTLTSLPLVLGGTSLTLYLPASTSPHRLATRTHATLSSLGLHRAAPLSVTNAFVFRNVTPGSYLVDVHCPSLAFRPLRVDVGRGDEGQDGAVAAWETFRGNDWANKGEALTLLRGSDGLGFEMRPLGAKVYFMERQGFSVLGILKSPMILMGLVGMLMVFGMPYLMENMDPEMKAEFEAQQRKGGPVASIMGGAGPQGGNPLGDFDMAAFLAGSKKKDTPLPLADADGPSRQQGVRR